MLRDGAPLTRPTRWSAGLKSFVDSEDPVGEPMIATWKLFPGAANQGESVNVTLVHLGESDNWIYVRALIIVDQLTWPHSRPGHIYVDRDQHWPSGQPSCVINFPTLAVNPRLSGVHSLLLRTIVEERKTR